MRRQRIAAALDAYELQVTRRRPSAAAAAAAAADAA